MWSVAGLAEHFPPEGGFGRFFILLTPLVLFGRVSGMAFVPFSLAGLQLLNYTLCSGVLSLKYPYCTVQLGALTRYYPGIGPAAVLRCFKYKGRVESWARTEKSILTIGKRAV